MRFTLTKEGKKEWALRKLGGMVRVFATDEAPTDEEVSRTILNWFGNGGKDATYILIEEGKSFVETVSVKERMEFISIDVAITYQ